MIDLHLHLDGSLSEQDFLYLAKKDGINLGDDFPNNIYVPSSCLSLKEYLERFDLPLLLMQTKENLFHVANSLVRRLHNMGYIYAEIRFAPLLHLNKGLTQDEVTQAVLDGVNSALNEYKDLEVRIILCCMRHASEELNMETIKTVNKFKGTRVVAVDLAGDELLHPSSYFSKIFSKAQEFELNVTIHAGESSDSEEIMQALNNGAMRIGHGVHLSLDEETVKKVKNKNICFEFCPTSNLQTKSLKTYHDVPLKKFMDLNIPVTINSDNMTVSNTDVINEYSYMIQTFDLKESDIFKLLNTSIRYAFCDNKTKENLSKLLEERFASFYKKLVI